MEARLIPKSCQHWVAKKSYFPTVWKHSITWIWSTPCIIFSYHIRLSVRHQLTLWQFQRSQSAGPNLVPLSHTLVKSSSHFWGYRRHKKKAATKHIQLLAFNLNFAQSVLQLFSKCSQNPCLVNLSTFSLHTNRTWMWLASIEIKCTSAFYTCTIMYFPDVLDGLEGSFHNAGLPIRPRPLAGSFLRASWTQSPPHLLTFWTFALKVSRQLGSFHKACHHLMSKDIAWQILTDSLLSFLLSYFGPFSSEDVLLGLEGHFIM